MLKLNQKLKKLRIKNNLTQVELADKADTNYMVPPTRNSFPITIRLYNHYLPYP